MTSAILVYSIAIWGLIKKKSRMETGLLVGLCFIMAWLSDDRYDFVNYEIGYEQVANGITTRFETGYVVAMKLGNLLGLDYMQFRAAISAIALFLLVCALYSFTTDINIPLALGLVFPLIFMFPIQRYFLGSAIVLYSFRYLMQQNTSGVIKYCLCTVLASLIHSSLFFFFLVPVYKLIMDKKKFLWISIISTVVFTVMAQNGLLGKVLNRLPLGSSVERALLSGEKANANGLILMTIIIAMVAGPGLLSVHFYQLASHKNKSPQMNIYMDMVYYINVFSFYLLALRVYSSTSIRLLYIIILINYAAAANTLLVRKRSLRHYDVGALYTYIALIADSVGILMIELLYESPYLKDVVFWMHFNTNPIFQSINNFL